MTAYRSNEMPQQPYLLDNFTGGINLRGQPLAIAKEDLIDAVNVYPVATGHLRGRGGQTNYNFVPIDGNPIKSLYRFYKQNAQGITLATSGLNVYRGNDVGGTFTPIDTGYTSNQRFSFTTWTAKDKVYWVNNFQPLKSYDGTTVATVAGSPPIGFQVECYLDRLWIMVQNGVRFSDLLTDDIWQSAALLNISDNKGGTGQFLKAANRILIAGKSSGLWRLEGSPLLGNVFVKYSDVGCIAPWTADTVTILESGQVIPVGVTFLGRDGVYLTDGYSVTLISSKIDPLFTGYFRDAVGKYYSKQRQYWLSFNPAGGANNTTWVCSNLDVKGTRSAWTRYTGFACDSFSEWNGGGDNGQFLSGRSDGGIVRYLDVGPHDLGQSYTCQFATYYVGDPKQNKQVRWLRPVFDATQPVHYTIDFFQKQFTTGPIETDVMGPFQWNVSFWNQANWAGPSLSSVRQSVIDGRYGRYLSFGFQNTGDGPDFRFFQLECDTQIKDSRFHDLFSLNNAP